jgi:O-antigen/teichoic acid export membrane protein
MVVGRQVSRVSSKPRWMTNLSVDRAQSRGRRIVLSMLTGLPAFGLQVVGGLLLVTLAWRALGPEGFGLWSAITALAPMIALGDLGVGNALISIVASALGRDDEPAARRAVAMAIALATIAAVLLSVVLWVAYAELDWTAWFKLPRDTPFAPALGVLVFAGCRLLLLPLGMVTKLRTGLQENFVNSAWDAAGVCLSVGLFYLASRAGAGLPVLLLASGAGPLVAVCGNWLGLVGRHVIPRPRDLDSKEVRPLLRLGMLFFALNLSMLLASAADNLVAIRFLGAAATAELAIASKIVMVGQATLNVALIPLWPAFADAIARRDGRWVRRALQLSLLASCGAGIVLAAAFLLGANQAVALWLGPDARLSAGILWANAVWLVLQANGIVAAMFMNGANIVRFQVVQALSFGLLAFALKLVLVSPLGAAGIVWATDVAYIVTTLPFCFWFIRRWLARAEWA